MSLADAQKYEEKSRQRNQPQSQQRQQQQQAAQQQQQAAQQQQQAAQQQPPTCPEGAHNPDAMDFDEDVPF